MEIDYCLLTFFVEEEGAVGGVVHEEVFHMVVGNLTKLSRYPQRYLSGRFPFFAALRTALASG